MQEIGWLQHICEDKHTHAHAHTNIHIHAHKHSHTRREWRGEGDARIKIKPHKRRRHKRDREEIHLRICKKEEAPIANKHSGGGELWGAMHSQRRGHRTRG